MHQLKVHIIHVGNMANKGTQALLMTDISVIKEVLRDNVEFCISTVDVEGARRLSLPVKATILPPLVDIPYERADSYARKSGHKRAGLRYKLFAMASLVFSFIQILLSVISAVLVKIGLRSFYRSEVLEHIKDCNVIVSCSDENFKEHPSFLPLNIYWIVIWWSMLISRTVKILIAKFFGKPVIVFPNSVGPFRTWIGRVMSRLALNNCDCVMVREPISYNLVKSLRIKSPTILTSDTTLLFKTRSHSTIDEFPDLVIGVFPGVYGFSLSENAIRSYVSSHAKALDRVVEKYGLHVVFLPHYVAGFQYDDLEICKLMLAEMRNADKAKIVLAKSVEEAKEIINRMDMVVSSKMHPTVLAASAYVPALCIAYDTKQIGFFKSLGLSDCVISLPEASYEKLFSKIDHVWNKRDHIAALLEKRVPVLQKHIRESIALALASFIEAS